MIERHVQVEMLFLIAGASACSALLVAKLVLMAYDDLRKTWRKVKRP
jgi:hypothetical protein